eukprot:TRINITY_DN22853_c0_g1_i1.p1 TRINITY_DN22853_c0_g1~~TRINITY_DN22853_c0_g1_i1.p1  ORF type:complete len:652 (+),score=261.71 TRINITY_DN22853_c0_g1_i1:106-2061(+)
MSSYVEQAAVCDLRILDEIRRKNMNSIAVDKTKVQEQMARRNFLLSKLPSSPASASASASASPSVAGRRRGTGTSGASAFQMVSQTEYQDLCNEYDDAVQALCEVMSHGDAVALLPTELQERIKGIVQTEAEASVRSSRESFEMNQAAFEAEEPFAGSTRAPITPSLAAKIAAEAADAEEELPGGDDMEELDAFTPGRKSITGRKCVRVQAEDPRRGSSPVALMRVGGRRYTVTLSKNSKNPFAKAAEGAKGASAWKNMQNRLAEVKFQTMLQTYCDNESEHPVYKVVLTGGPCAGKSSGMASMKNELELQGFNVFCVPEAATLLIGGGGAVCFGVGTEDASYGFQLALLETQMALEDAFIALANACKKKAVVLCDRGSMDGRAFCNEKLWDRILGSGGWTTEELRDQRYDLVLHLVTAADGAPEYYGDETNACRTETPEQAIEQDLKLQGCWTGFPHLKIIDNSTNFAEKMQRCLRPILELVGVDRRPGSLKKYLLASPLAKEDVDIPTTQSNLTIHVLKGSKPGNVIHVIHRIDGKSHTYTYQNIRQENDSMFKVERTLDVKAYENFLTQVDRKHTIIVKNNIYFIYKNQTFEIGTYVEPEAKRGTGILIVETNKNHEGYEMKVEFPAFILPLAPKDITSEKVGAEYII